MHNKSFALVNFASVAFLVETSRRYGKTKTCHLQVVYPLVRAHRILNAQNIPSPAAPRSSRSKHDKKKETKEKKEKQPSLFDPALHRLGLLPARKYGDIIRIPIGPWNVSSHLPSLINDQRVQNIVNEWEPPDACTYVACEVCGQKMPSVTSAYTVEW